MKRRDAAGALVSAAQNCRPGFPQRRLRRTGLARKRLTRSEDAANFRNAVTQSCVDGAEGRWRMAREATTRAERVRQASRERRELARQELRAVILDAAAALFLEEGYDAFSMRHVAERIGYSATTIYRHFEDKDDLLFSVVDRGFSEFGARLAEAAASTTDPVRRLAAIGRAYVRFGLEQPGYYRVMFVDRSEYLATPPAGSEQPRMRSFGVLQDAVNLAVDAGAVRRGDTRAYAHALWALVHGIVMLAVTFPERRQFDSDAAVGRAIGYIFDGLKAR
jgi:AcrR family transcriptional regulator